MFEEFIGSTAGRTVIGALIAALSIAIIDLNYKLFFKRALDFVFASVFIIILSPVLIVGSIFSKSNAGEVFELTACPGSKGKIIYVHSFAGIEGKLRNLPRIFDVLIGNMSFVGTKLIPLSDGAFMDDKAMGRFNARPGIFNHLAIGGSEELAYERMFALDERYAKKCELFRDIFTVIASLALYIRGEGNSYLGEAGNKSYAEVLVERGEITETDAQSATELSREAVENDEKAKDFKRRKSL